MQKNEEPMNQEQDDFRQRVRSSSNGADPQFWKSVQELSLQEKSLYADIDYTKGNVNTKVQKRYYITRGVRNFMYFLFVSSLIADFIYTAYTAYKDELWDVLICCMIAYVFLFLYLTCDNPVSMFIYVFCFLVGRFCTISLRRQYKVVWKVNPATSSVFYFIVFYD